MQTRMKSTRQVGRKRQKKRRIPPVVLATAVNNVGKTETESLSGQKGPTLHLGPVEKKHGTKGGCL